jgi:hypothetical protein
MLDEDLKFGDQIKECESSIRQTIAILVEQAVNLNLQVEKLVEVISRKEKAND